MSKIRENWSTRFKHLYYLGYDISTEDRFFGYVWEEISGYDEDGNPIFIEVEGDHFESKFGDRWVPAGVHPVTSCLDRIRQSLGTDKTKFDDINRFRVKSIYNLTDLAKKYNRFYKNGKIDDFVGEQIGYKKKGLSGSDKYTLCADMLNDKLRLYLDKEFIARPIVRLSTVQYNLVFDTNEAIESGKRILLWDVCPRGQKTISACAVSVERNFELTVISSYVGTCYKSFKEDLSDWDQFKNIILVDGKDLDAIKKVKKFLEEGKQVFLYLPQTMTPQRKGKLFRYVSSLPINLFWIIDEADFGAHRPKQSDLFKKYVKQEDVLLIMTGSNSDRAIEPYDVDWMSSVTYYELLVNKIDSTEYLQKSKPPVINPHNLNYFQLDKRRDLYYVAVEGYQLNLFDTVEYAIKQGKILSDDFKKLPSWQSFIADPRKNQDWFIITMQAMFLNRHNIPELHITSHLDYNVVKGRSISICWLPENTKTNKEFPVLDIIVDIAQSALPDKLCVSLSGSHTSQRKAQQYIKELIEKNPNKDIIIFASKIGQRSFSIGDLGDTYLMYDRGQHGGTVQKMSRVVTSNGNYDKIGRIFSCSFDPNRDDKFDQYILETASNLHKRKDTKGDLKEQLRKVFRSIHICSITGDGLLKWEEDDFVNKAIQRNSLFRVMGKKTDITNLTNEQIVALSNGKSDGLFLDKKKVTKHGKAKDSEDTNKGNKTKTKVTDNIKQKALAVISSIYI